MCRITYEYDGRLCYYAGIEIKDEDEHQQLTKCVSYECIWVITGLSSGECINSGLDYWNSGQCTGQFLNQACAGRVYKGQLALYKVLIHYNGR